MCIALKLTSFWNEITEFRLKQLYIASALGERCNSFPVLSSMLILSEIILLNEAKFQIMIGKIKKKGAKE